MCAHQSTTVPIVTALCRSDAVKSPALTASDSDDALQWGWGEGLQKDLVKACTVRESFGRLVRLGSGSPLPSHSSKGHAEFNSCPHGRKGAPACFYLVQSLSRSIASTLGVRHDKVTVLDEGRFTLMEHVWTTVAKIGTGYRQCMKSQWHVGTQSTNKKCKYTRKTGRIYSILWIFPLLFLKILLGYP